MERARVVVELPSRATRPIALLDRRSGVSVRVGVVGAPPIASTTRDDGALVFRGAVPPSGAEMVVAPTSDGFEDFVRYEARPAGEEIRYWLSPSAGTGLRLVEGVLEVVDHFGAPRLRMARPSIRDAEGREQLVPVRVEGCRVDTLPRAPWGHPPVSPGADRCEIVLSFGGLGLTYPAVLDPAWSSTAELATARARGAICRLLDGRVLVAGGTKNIDGGPIYFEAEMFDPDTDTWASTASMSHRREKAPCVTLLSGEALIAGGSSSDAQAPATSEIYDPATGTWSVAPMVTPREGHTLSLLDDGRALAAGGLSNGVIVSSMDAFDPASDTWLAGGSMLQARSRHAAALLPDHTVLFAGGEGPSALNTAEIYEPTTGTSVEVSGNLGHHSIALVPMGTELVAIGGEVDGGFTASADAFDPGTQSWRSLAPLPAKRKDHVVASLPSGRVLVAGGRAGNGSEPAADTSSYDPEHDVWLDAGALEPRIEALSIKLSDGRVLVAGGLAPPNLDTTKSVFLFSEQPRGAPCTEPGACSSGECWDGVCCDGFCGKPCVQCNAVGTCEPIVSGEDPGACEGEQTCDASSRCLGALGIGCVDGNECASGHCVDRVCCDRTCDSQCEACNLSGAEGVCSLVVGEPRGVRPPCDEGTVCNGDGPACAALSLCEGSHVAVAADGAKTDCSPYACGANGICRDTCSSFRDCAEPFLCDTEGHCVTPSAEPASAGCASSPTLPSRGRLAVVAVAVLAIAARRRRRSRQ